jgi:hypothetical protein
MDDLTATPMSAISSFTLLNAFAVTDLAALQEKTVQLGYNEVRGDQHMSITALEHVVSNFQKKNMF